MMVSARGLARYYTEGQPVSMLSDSYTAIGHGAMPVIIFLVVAVIFHIALRYTKYGKYTYAIGGASTLPPTPATSSWKSPCPTAPT